MCFCLQRLVAICFIMGPLLGGLHTSCKSAIRRGAALQGGRNKRRRFNGQHESRRGRGEGITKE